MWLLLISPIIDIPPPRCTTAPFLSLLCGIAAVVSWLLVIYIPTSKVLWTVIKALWQQPLHLHVGHGDPPVDSEVLVGRAGGVRAVGEGGGGSDSGPGRRGALYGRVCMDTVPAFIASSLRLSRTDMHIQRSEHLLLQAVRRRDQPDHLQSAPSLPPPPSALRYASPHAWHCAR